MSTFSSLEVGKRALAAQRLGLDTTGQNIANVNTPNYSRRLANFSENDSKLLTGSGFAGTGAILDNLRSFREDLFDKEIRSNLSRQSGYEYDEKMITNIETILNEPSDLGINETVTKFFNAFSELAQNPENVSLRSFVIDQAKTLVEKFHTTAQNFNEARTQIVGDINQNVGKINSLLKDIADLNANVAGSRSLSDGQNQTFIDKREEKLEQLSKIIGINVTKGDLGTVNVFINGINVVTKDVYSELHTQTDINSTTGESTIQLINTDSNGNMLNYINPSNGELGSQLKHYNVTLDNKDSSGNYSVFSKLDAFADAIVQRVNSLTSTGYGLDDLGATPPGRNFFDPIVGNATASTIEITSSILNNPRNIPISDTAGESGNNIIGIKISELASDNTFIESQTPSEFYSNLVGRVGSMGSEAINGKNATKIVGDQLANQRESVIGVNMDEEAVNLIKFQKSFEASSRIINTMSELLTTIVNLGK